MSISAIPPTGSITGFSPVTAANALATVSNTATNPATPATPATNPATNLATNPVTTSTVIAQTYGFAPSLIVPIYQPAFYQPLSQNPDVVTGVSQVEVVPRIGQYPGSYFDTYA